MNLEFLMASLPYLKLGEPAGITLADFRAACGEQLSPKLYDVVCALLDETDSRHPFVTAWRDREAILRNAIVRYRAARRRQPADPWLREISGSDMQIDQRVSSAFDLPNPLERERAFLGLRWQLLENLAGLQPMAADALLAYAVKLKLATMWASLDVQAGQERFDAIFT